MAVEARRIDGLIAAELSLPCGARALRERSARLWSALRSALLLGIFLLEVCGSGSPDDEDARWTYSGADRLARSNSGKNECESSCNSDELQILQVSILLEDSKGISTRLHC
jgi:hypothetical protein